MREGDGHAVSFRPARQRRGRNLLERLRQLREPASEPDDGVAAVDPEDTTVGAYDFLEEDLDAPRTDFLAPVPARDAAALAAAADDEAATGGGEEIERDGSPMADSGQLEQDPPRSGDVKAQRALAVFNAGIHPPRIAGIARSLGAPDVSVVALEQSGSRVAIVIAWELCWYRYEVDLGEEAAGANLAAQGTELSELQDDELPANAAAAQDGSLALVASSLR